VEAVSIEQNGLDDIFAAAVEIVDAGQREGYLRRVMAEDAAGLAELQGLVRDYFAAGSLLDRPAVVNPTFDHSRAASVGSQIGPYKLVEQIGEGGMGVVYLALQKEPIRRLVALKIIKPGMDSRQVVARFASERQALAMMNHPHIAKVLDAGATESGNPYFVMELVRGIPITDFCDQHKLDLRQRLELFVKVCGAVQHAHQKGVIHRDLKPSNVLVELADVKGVPKVIDFGVAKATQQPLTDGSLVTGFAQMIGTPMYMSPEQAQLNSLDVDTRSDIYSLGVLLYELLTGTTPFDKASLEQAGLDGMRRIICEQEPSRPSHKISTLEAQLLSTVSNRRQMDPRQLSLSMQRELDWIVMKTLEKDRCRRYETASELAADILRHLRGEPVEACPPSWTYRCGKLMRRHKTALVTAGLVLIALVLGTAASLWQARQAQAAAAEAKIAQEEAQVERDAAELERKFAQAITDFVQNDFLALTSVIGQDLFGGEGDETLSKNTTLRELLDRAADKLQARADLAPRTAAELYWMIGGSYIGVGELERAVRFLEKCVALRRQELGPHDPAALEAERILAGAYWESGMRSEAVALFEHVWDAQVTKLGADHPDSLVTLNSLAAAYLTEGKLSQAVALHEQVRDARVKKLGGHHPDTLSISIKDLNMLTEGPLDVPARTLFGPDGRFYVLNSGLYAGGGSVAVFDPVTGEFIEMFVSVGSGGLENPADMTFGPDGDLYIPSHSGPGTLRNRILKFNGVSGAFLGEFITAGSGGANGITHLQFGRDVNGDEMPDLFVCSALSEEILVFDGVTGAFIDVFVQADAKRTRRPFRCQFRNGAEGPELLVVTRPGTNVLRYDGITGELIDVLVDRQSFPPELKLGALDDIQLGPNGDLYLTTTRSIDTINGTNDLARVLRLDKNGVFLEVFIPANAGGWSAAAPRLTFDAWSERLYVNSGDTNEILRFEGPLSSDPGAFIDVFVQGVGFILLTALDINDAGQIVGLGYPKGRRNITGRLAAYLYTPPAAGEAVGRVQDLLVHGLNFQEEATAINNDGDVAGHFLSAETERYHAFLWTPEIGFVDLGSLAGRDTYVTAVCDRSTGGDVQVTGYAVAPWGNLGWRYDSATGTMQNLGLISGSKGDGQN